MQKFTDLIDKYLESFEKEAEQAGADSLLLDTFSKEELKDRFGEKASPVNDEEYGYGTALIALRRIIKDDLAQKKVDGVNFMDPSEFEALTIDMDKDAIQEFKKDRKIIVNDPHLLYAYVTDALNTLKENHATHLAKAHEKNPDLDRYEIEDGFDQFIRKATIKNRIELLKQGTQDKYDQGRFFPFGAKPN